ncbi:hypothetical protein HaLaN_23066 [Haematococcus lacustris]|uniref:Uncharacterized protein n=1 Tax=Haematococcus lacustris TaxID=44745 RepID=A0A699Z813_HAELA|nr:hypothetical protein HaLaN_11630 [Haematococcus lacustris]GFH25146.1 hypothetical protein HaLaN_23066 [Haematococcus lacustris]
MPSIYEGPDDGLPVLGSVSAFNPNFDWGQYATSFMDEDDQGIGLSTDHFHAATFTRACRHVSQRATESNCPADQLPPAPDFSISLLGGDMEGDLLSQYIYQD